MMKKILFGTTALLAAASFSASAEASDPIKLGVGGYMTWYVAAADQDDASSSDSNVNSFDVQSDVEIQFTGETTLDNGMTVGAVVELEASEDSQGDTIDESYMYVSGNYGKLNVGATNGAAALSAVMAPSVSEVGAAGDGSDLETYLLVPSTVNVLEVAQQHTGDAPKLTYFTPRMYGLQAGVSYVPGGDTNGDETNNNITRPTAWDEAWAFSLSYEGEFEGVGVAAAATYGILDDTTNNNTAGTASMQDNEIQNIGGGLNLSYAGFTVGGGVMRQIANIDTAQAALDGFSWNVGVSYEEGPYAVSFTYYNSAVRGDDAVGGTVAATTGQDEHQEYQLAGTYALGAGVKLFAEVDYLDAENEGEGVANNDQNGNEGAIGGAVGLALSF